MARALALAERGRGYVEPNPLVGAVVVRDERAVGEGWHARFGEAHAEVNALAAAGESAQEATLYVTLEPCCHTGKTPPCTEAVLRSGVRRVVAAMRDPFPQVCGQGLALLRSRKIDVEVGIGEAEAHQLNAPYLKLVTTSRPYVHAKWAMTLDGKICTRTGDSKWISNEAVLRAVRTNRGLMDAIIVGIGTALADDPLLTARPPGPRVPVRVVLDRRGRLPLSSRLVATAREAPLLVATAGQSADEWRHGLEAAGAEVLPLPVTAGRLSVPSLLDELGRRRMTNVLVEGGADVLGSFLDAGEIDAVHVCIAPRLVGGSEAKTPVAGIGVARLADALQLAEWRTEVVENNIVVHGRR
jgi:diaminohydroxyphosphoribosylaminopyrimidine deaminase/5-amino-6-(5-phosphoribosylamino)uracil reductase